MRTGDIVETKSMLFQEEDKIREEEQYDGFVAIVTSERDESDSEIIETYHSLWKIEENFRISKSDFKPRPIYVSLESHIEAHFLTFFSVSPDTDSRTPHEPD